uniref:Uncharacterized protein n=1 Tax=Arundo donax TaxID=35708 RepID=A0A0A9F496_ARUDO
MRAKLTALCGSRSTAHFKAQLSNN